MTSPTVGATPAGVAVHPHVRVARTDAMGWHVVASEPVAAGEVLVRVPLTSALDLSPSRLPSLVAAGAPPLAVSTVLLMRELHHADVPPVLGPHRDVLLALPPVGNVLRWTPAQVRWLAGTCLANAPAAMPLRRRHRDIVVPWLSTPAAAADDLPAACRDEEAFITAATLVMSRCFHGPGSANAARPSADPVPAVASGGGGGAAVEAAVGPGDGPFLVPVCDYFNHDEARCAARLHACSDEFSLVATRAIAAGEQVYTTYGQLSDAQLLHTYGFVPASDAGDDAAAAAAALASSLDTKPSIAIPAALLPNPHASLSLTLDDVVVGVRTAAPELDAPPAPEPKRRRGAKAAAGGRPNEAPRVEAASPLEQAAAACRRLTTGMPLAGPFECVAGSGWTSGNVAWWLRCVPAELATALAVCSMPPPSLQAYMEGCREAGATLPLPFIAPTAAVAAAAAAAGAGDDGDGDEGDDAMAAIEDALTSAAALVCVLKCKLTRAGPQPYVSTLADDLRWCAGAHTPAPSAAAAPPPAVGSKRPRPSPAGLTDDGDGDADADGAAAMRTVAMREKLLAQGLIAALVADMAAAQGAMGGGSDSDGGGSDGSDRDGND